MDNESTYNKPTMLVMQLVLQLSTKQCESCVVFTRNFVSNYNKTKYTVVIEIATVVFWVDMLSHRYVLSVNVAIKTRYVIGHTYLT